MINLVTVIVLIYVFDLFEGPKIVKNVYNNTIIPKYEKCKRLNNMVSTQYKGFFQILYVSTQMICKVLYLNVIQYFNNSVVKLDKNTYEIKYVINGKMYKLISKMKRGPKKVLLVYDENEEDVSDLICQYLGPEENFHNIKYNPKFFNREELVFELSSGDEKKYVKEEEIKL
jgi:hypothetical protein